MYEINFSVDHILKDGEVKELTDRVMKKLGLSKNQFLHFSVKQFPPIRILNTDEFKDPVINMSMMALISHERWLNAVAALVPYSTGIVDMQFYPTDVKSINVLSDGTWVIQMNSSEPEYLKWQIPNRMSQWGVKKWRITREAIEKPNETLKIL